MDRPRAPIDRLIRPFQVFAANKLAGAILLLAATVVAMVWANSPWRALYDRLLAMTFTVGIGDFVLAKPVQLWVNDGLMAFFFFVVGLEIKRELLAGELSSARKAALPITAALGGMVVPALLYHLLNHGGPGAPGWGIPMATDIAFALGILALLGDRVPVGLKIFLTALAIADDIGAILVIALFYTESISLVSLALGGLFFLLSIAANLAGVRNAVVYFLLGAAVWLAFLKSGLHATLAAVLMAMTIPARTRTEGKAVLEQLTSLLDALRGAGMSSPKTMLDVEQHHIVEEMERTLEDATAPLQRLEHAIVGVVTFLVLPLFALANAGVAIGGGLSEAIQHPVALGIIVGLFVGKQVGITLFARIAVGARLAALPQGVTWRQIHGVAILGGIGFTMSLFVASLAFHTPALMDVSKVGILSASLVSAVVGLLLLRPSLKP